MTPSATTAAKEKTPMPPQTLKPHAGRPEPGTDDTPIPPTTCSVQEPGCGSNPAEAAAQKRIAQARAWLWWAELSWRSLRTQKCHGRTTARSRRAEAGENHRACQPVAAENHVTAAEESQPWSHSSRGACPGGHRPVACSARPGPATEPIAILAATITSGSPGAPSRIRRPAR